MYWSIKVVAIVDPRNNVEAFSMWNILNFFVKQYYILKYLKTESRYFVDTNNFRKLILKVEIHGPRSL